MVKIKKKKKSIACYLLFFTFNFMLVHKAFPKSLHGWYEKADTINKNSLTTVILISTSAVNQKKKVYIFFLTQRFHFFISAKNAINPY